MRFADQAYAAHHARSEEDRRAPVKEGVLGRFALDFVVVRGRAGVARV
jgi:hypothetical protein